MSTIIIKADSKSSKLLSELAKKMGGEATSIKDDQYEDILFGNLMDSEKTNKKTLREEVMKALEIK